MITEEEHSMKHLKEISKSLAEPVKASCCKDGADTPLKTPEEKDAKKTP